MGSWAGPSALPGAPWRLLEATRGQRDEYLSKSSRVPWVFHGKRWGPSASKLQKVLQTHFPRPRRAFPPWPPPAAGTRRVPRHPRRHRPGIATLSRRVQRGAGRTGGTLGRRQGGRARHCWGRGAWAQGLGCRGRGAAGAPGQRDGAAGLSPRGAAMPGHGTLAREQDANARPCSLIFLVRGCDRTSQGQSFSFNRLAIHHASP